MYGPILPVYQDRYLLLPHFWRKNQIGKPSLSVVQEKTDEVITYRLRFDINYHIKSGYSILKSLKVCFSSEDVTSRK